MNLPAEPCCPPDASQITPTQNFKSKTLPERVVAIALIGVSEAFMNSLLAGRDDALMCALFALFLSSADGLQVVMCLCTKVTAGLCVCVCACMCWASHVPTLFSLLTTGAIKISWSGDRWWFSALRSQTQASSWLGGLHRRQCFQVNDPLNKHWSLISKSNTIKGATTFQHERFSLLVVVLASKATDLI